MKHLAKIFLSIIAISSVFLVGVPHANSANADPVYTTLRSIDTGTFNEYRYRITEQFFALREGYEINRVMEKSVLEKMVLLSDEAYKYLPDNLKNKNYLSELQIDLKRAFKSPGNEVAYSELIESLAKYLESVEISAIDGEIYAAPLEGNAPLTVTMRAKVQDPSGTQIKDGDYTWWVDIAGQEVVIGRGPSFNYTFKKEGQFSVFLDVTSSHKNTAGFTDVLPLRERIEINVKEKVASMIIKVNGDRVEDDELKFTPEDANYGLIFDATSSTPTSGTKFTRTQWDFGNGITRSNAGGPKIERIRYGREGDFNVALRLTTNEGKIVEKNFTLYIRDPIARIEVNREDGYIGDKFTFGAKPSGNYRDLTYSWEVINIDTDKTLYQKTDKAITYVFTDKGKYNVRLRVRRASGEVDEDTRIVYVTSQAPIAEYESSIPLTHKPNRVLLDASRSYDPDITDDGNLTYEWYIDGNRVNLQDPSLNGAVGYYTFDSIGTHSVNLEVTDPDGITTIKKGSVDIDSILSVEMFAFPRVIQRGSFIKFTSQSPEAEVYEWDFGDGQRKGGSFDKTTHTFENSGIFDVKLTVTDKDNNKNTFNRTVYVSDSEKPMSVIDVSLGSLEEPAYDASACDGKGAYVTDRISTLTFNGVESINVDGGTQGLEYSWRVGQGKFSSASSVIHRFDEIGCFPVKLTVKSNKNKKTHVSEVMMDVRNALPTLSSLKVDVLNPNEDPLIVEVKAQGAKDPDGVIQSYLWYYYTDTDTEPQDFRSTMGPGTAFVIPKITGNYYFVAILKDNNEARITSEEITGSRYFTTVTGDNINTPIVELSVNDTSVIIGEEVVFTANAKNILGKDISKEAKFSWDFDGDGFYDTETKDKTVAYKYRKSGEFFPKVKVKYRGISSTKNLTVNVNNTLTPDFGYISLGNKFIFFDRSTGQVESRVWDLGDGTTKSGTYIEHEYTDKKTSHNVSLQISEGTTTKDTEKKVLKNMKNIILAKRGNISAFSSPVADSDGRIELSEPLEKVFIYTGESKGEIVAYAIDYDIEQDSDLNGGVDDDEDNKGTASYNTGDVIEVPLTDYRKQKFRVFLKSSDGSVIGSKDFTIEKLYIEDKNIDPDTLVFNGVSQSEKEKIEFLKTTLSKLSQQDKLRSMNFIQKLQENWNDNTEKTRTILDFENYIFELGLINEDEIIDTLESLLVEGQEDQSSKQITYQALINLIPADIHCQVTSGTCRDNLISKITDIRESDDIEYNRMLGKEILEIIGSTDTMTSAQKLDFKAILTTLVYGGEVASIPEAEQEEVTSEPTESTDEVNQSSPRGLVGVIISIAKWIFYFILLFLLIILGFFVLYKFMSEKDESFTEFITRLTSGGGKKDEDENDDPLAPKPQEKKESDKEVSDIFSIPTKEEKTQETISEQKTASKQEVTPVKKEKTSKPITDFSKDFQKKEQSPKDKVSQEEVPSWLKGSFAPDIDTPNKEEKTQEKTEEKKEEIVESEKKNAPERKSNTPSKKIDAYSSPFDVKPAPKKEEKVQKTNISPKGDTSVKKDENTENSKITLSQDKNSQQTTEKKTGEIEKKEEKFDLEKDTKIQSDDNIPDWLKGSFDPEPKKEEEKPEAGVEEKTQENLPQEQTNKSEKQEEKSSEDTGGGTKEKVDQEEKGEKNDASQKKGTKKDTSASTKLVSEEKEEKAKAVTAPVEKIEKKVSSNKQEDTKEKTDTAEKKQELKETREEGPELTITTPEKKTTTKSDTNKKDELWDDGMKIPDWLKMDDDR